LGLRTAMTVRPRLKAALVILASVALAVALRRLLLQVGGLALGAAALCFVAAPVARAFERRLSRPTAALAALLSIAALVGLLLWLLLPGMLREVKGLARALPDSLVQLKAWLDRARAGIEARLPVSVPELDFSGLQATLSGLAGGTFSLAVNLADLVGRLSMMAVLSYFFLCDRDRLLLRLELLVPRAWRPVAVRMGNAVNRELRLYLRGQLLIAGAVALLSVGALLAVGVRSALVLGTVIGLMNMIPYFGPYIGGAPAVLIALGDGWQRALLTVAALALVQQLDGSWISPRIMESLTGFSPAVVLIGIYAGARAGGVAGMLFAMPVMLTVRTLFRIFVQKYENI